MTEERIIDFPSNFSVGKLFVIQPEKREFLANAQGLVKLPPDQEVELEVEWNLKSGLDFVKKMGSDDLASFVVAGPDFDDRSISTLSHLSGLSSLRLGYTKATPTGLDKLAALKTLRHINLERAGWALDKTLIEALSQFKALEKIDFGLIGLSSKSKLTSNQRNEIQICLEVLRDNLPELQEINYGFLKTARSWQKLANKLGAKFDIQSSIDESLIGTENISFVGLEKKFDNTAINWEDREPRITITFQDWMITLGAFLSEYDYDELVVSLDTEYASKKEFSLDIRRKWPLRHVIGKIIVSIVSKIWRLIFHNDRPPWQTGYTEIDNYFKVDTPPSQQATTLALINNSEVRVGIKNALHEYWHWLYIGKNIDGQHTIRISQSDSWDSMEQLSIESVQASIGLMKSLLVELVKLDVIEG